MKLLSMTAVLISILSWFQAKTPTVPTAGFRVRGHVNGLPVDAPAGLIGVELIGPDLTMTVPVGSDGTFEFSNVPPVRIALRTTALRTALLIVPMVDKDVDGVELTVTSPQVLGQVVLEGGGRLPTSRNPLLPILRLEARGSQGNVVSHQFIRSDGAFGFLPLPSDDYNIRVTLVPAGYSVKSISYSGVDVMRTPVKLMGPSYSFMRITLTTAPVPSVGLPGDAPEVAQIAPAFGDATLVVSQSGRGPLYTEGSLAFFKVHSTDSQKFEEEKRLGGDWCIPPPATLPAGIPAGLLRLRCDPTGSNAQDSLAFSLPAGTYEVAGFVRPCDGNCGMLDADTDECKASFAIKAGETLYAERLSTGRMCTVVISQKPKALGITQ